METPEMTKAAEAYEAELRALIDDPRCTPVGRLRNRLLLAVDRRWKAEMVSCFGEAAGRGMTVDDLASAVADALAYLLVPAVGIMLGESGNVDRIERLSCLVANRVHAAAHSHAQATLAGELASITHLKIDADGHIVDDHAKGETVN